MNPRGNPRLSTFFGINRRCSAAMFSIVSIKNCNHKSLGIYYLYSSLLFGISGHGIASIYRKLVFQ